MWICDSYTHILLICFIVLGWKSESSKLVPHFLVLALVARCLDLIWRLLTLRLRILSTNLIILLPKPRFFEFIQNRKKNLWIWKKPHWKLVTYVEVTLVSKFHPFWCPVAQESKLERKFLGSPDISGSFTGYIR
jgi:hypothetical protein